jgi:hypothetical protein
LLPHAIRDAHDTFIPCSSAGRICRFLEQWEVNLNCLKAMGIDSSVAVEAMEKLAGDLKRCEERLRDNTWWNRVNLKKAIDEKVLLYSAESNGMCGGL